MERGEEQPQKLPEPVEQQRDVVAGGGQDGVDGVALLAGEVVAVHPVFGLDVADGSIAERRRICRLMAGVMHRFWPAVMTLNLWL